MTLPYAPDPVPTIPIDVSHRDGTSDTGAHVRPWDARDVYKIGVAPALAAISEGAVEAMAAWAADRVGPNGGRDSTVPVPLGVGWYMEVAYDTATGTFAWWDPNGDNGIDAIFAGTVQRTRP